MKILLIVIVGFCIGYALGWVFENTIKKVDGKKEVDDYNSFSTRNAEEYYNETYKNKYEKK